MLGGLRKEGREPIQFYRTFLSKNGKIKIKNVIVYTDLVMFYIFSENGFYQLLVFRLFALDNWR